MVELEELLLNVNGETLPILNEDDEDDFVPPARLAFHTEPKLCDFILRSAIISVPLAIRSSGVGSGSGLFLADDDKQQQGQHHGRGINRGREIFRSTPLMAAIDYGNDGFCHHCFKDAKAGEQPLLKFGGFGGAGDQEKMEEVKACTGCHVARFCSKKCQKAAWSKFHKDECKILRSVPRMKAQHLLAHRLVFWQQRGFITTSQGKAIDMLEDHFNEYTKDEERSPEVYGIAVAICKATGGKANMGLVWKLVPALRTNCIRMRPASGKEAVGYALDLLSATIQHSCHPNAFAFFEGTELRVRSLKKILPGDEITICYIDPTIDLLQRQKILLKRHFFDCNCTRCKNEYKERKECVKTLGDGKISTLEKAQEQMLSLINAASSSQGMMSKGYDDLGKVETALRTIMRDALPVSHWPAHIEPLPMVRQTLAALYTSQKKYADGLRNALKGKLMSCRRDGPEWVNEMADVILIILETGCQLNEPSSPLLEDRTFPPAEDLQTVTYGYLYEMCREAGTIFGGDSEYAKAIINVFTPMVGKMTGDRPGSKEFAKAFEEAQGRLLQWANVTSHYALVMSS
ncbi:hypothetical protein QBC35DRAFT_544612 [Podospora australis]|uniref:Suppressor of anucleate metulae protein B n=1 Tax=Podospora australis TaxID=1536484 RepID=A0AAN7AE31_9PEZI|nr:hypothetical protein QBC35DRAFT_544612 [Podospora australis]